GLVAVARQVFDRLMPQPNQLEKRLPDLKVEALDLLKVPDGKVTEAGLRINLNVGVQYLAAWLSGNGCVPLYHLMEDAATAEISRSQVWQWIRHGAKLEDGGLVTLVRVREMLQEELAKIRSDGQARFAPGTLDLAAKLFDQ